MSIMRTIEDLLKDEVAFWRQTVALVGNKASESSSRRMRNALYTQTHENFPGRSTR